MFIENVKIKYGYDYPIFTDELVSLFSNYIRTYIFRLIKKAEDTGDLVCYSRGVYYVPRQTLVGKSTLNCELVAEKKYIKDTNDVFGVYGGINLLNKFGVTNQVANIPEIITNNEITRKRIVSIGTKKYIIRKSRCRITRDNYAIYTICQLFNDMDNKDILNEFSIKLIQNYMIENKIEKKDIIKFAMNFPSRVIKRMLEAKIFYDFT